MSWKLCIQNSETKLNLVRVMVVRKILTIVGLAGLAMAGFAQNQNGAAGGASGAHRGLPPRSTFGSTNGANSAPIRRNEEVLDVRYVSAVDCTGARDSSAALNALTGNPPTSNNAITGRTLSFGNCPSINLANTWVVYNQASFIITGLARGGEAGKAPTFTWSGAASGVMINMEYVDSFRVDGLSLQGGTNGGVGIVVDKNGSGGIWNTTDGKFSDDFFEGTATNWVGLSISPVSANNVEDMLIEHSAFYCNAPTSSTAAIGILIGASANAKLITMRNDWFYLCYYGVSELGGNMIITESDFEQNSGPCGSGTGADINISQNWDTDEITDNLTEDASRFLVVHSNIAFPVIVKGNHMGPGGCENQSLNYWDIGWGSAPFIFDGNSFDADSSLVNVIGDSLGNGLASQIYTRGNIWPNSTFNQWWKNGAATVSDDLNFRANLLLVNSADSNAYGTSFPSPILDFRAYMNGGTSSPDDFVIQNIQRSSSTAGTFLIKHQQGSTGTQFFGWDGSYPGINIAQIPTPSVLTVGQGGTAGSTSYTYAVVAYGPLGNTAGSSTFNTATGAATLNTTNYNVIEWYPVGGATKYCIWRTASSGSPSSTGDLGCVSAMQYLAGTYPTAGTAFGYGFGTIGCCNDYYTFNDTGLAGDSTSLPATNTTGGISLVNQITSTLATGTAPLSIASTTPVANLTVSNHPEVYEAGVLTTAEKIYTNTQAPTTGAATHIFASSFSYTSSSTFACSCTDQTAANACRAVPESATAVTLAGTGADVLWLECVGH